MHYSLKETKMNKSSFFNNATLSLIMYLNFKNLNEQDRRDFGHDRHKLDWIHS
mgnify:CR=1 FL=1